MAPSAAASSATTEPIMPGGTAAAPGGAAWSLGLPAGPVTSLVVGHLTIPSPHHQPKPTTRSSDPDQPDHPAPRARLPSATPHGLRPASSTLPTSNRTAEPAETRSRRLNTMPENGSVDTVVQWVRTTWTKRSRGALEAWRRNAAPIAFPLPTTAAPFVHEVLMHEHDNFQPRFTTMKAYPTPTPTTACSSEKTMDYCVHLVVTPFGTPRRWRRPPATRLAPVQWLRWQVNYRSSSSHDE
jgi:hypothetical protein